MTDSWCKINLLGRQSHRIKLGLRIQLRKLRAILSKVRLVEISYTFYMYVQEAQLLMGWPTHGVKLNLLGGQAHRIKLGLPAQLRKLRAILSFCLFHSYNFANN